MALALENGWSGEEALKKAEQKGFECPKEEMRKFIVSDIDEHSKVAQP